MTEKKKLTVNCAFCDLRNITREVLESYESVAVNCATAVVSPEAQPLLAEYAVSLNAASVTAVPREVVLSKHNGQYTIKAGAAVPEQPMGLMVNGGLVVEPGTQAQLEKYVFIQVNGCLQCPESLAGAASRVKVNGATEFYPDDAVLLKGRFQPDRIFALRAKEGRYFVGRRLIALDPKADYGRLAEKGVRFVTPRVLVTEQLLETVLALVPEDAEVQVVPDGTRYTAEDVTLDKTCLRKYGPKIFVDGNLELEPANEAVLAQMEYLEVDGDALVPEELLETFQSKATVHGQVQALPKGTRICDKTQVTIDPELLALCPEGLCVMDCGVVRFAGEVSPADIQERVKLIACGSVHCSEAQRSAVELICEDVGEVSCGEEGPFKGLLSQALSGNCINAASYTF